MSTAAPTPLPPSAGAPSAQAAAQSDATGDAVALSASSTDPQVKPQIVPASAKLVAHLSHLLSKPLHAAIVFGLVTYAVLHFLGAKMPTPRLKLVAAGAFAAVLYGTAALRDSDPAVGLKGLHILANDAAGGTNLSIVKRIHLAWYLVFPAIAVSAAFVKQLTPITMVPAAGLVMLLPSLLEKNGML